MAHMKVEQGYSLLNLLEPVVGLVQKTEMVTQGMATTADNKRLIYVGTVFPSNDPKTTDIVLETVDMTDDTNRPAGVTKVGRIYGDRLKTPLSNKAKTVSRRKGFVTLDAPECEL